RQLYNRLFDTPCRRATTETCPPAASTSAISAAFSSSVPCPPRFTRATISPSTSRVLLYVQKDSSFAHLVSADHKPHAGSDRTLTDDQHLQQAHEERRRRHRHRVRPYCSVDRRRGDRRVQAGWH